MRQASQGKTGAYRDLDVSTSQVSPSNTNHLCRSLRNDGTPCRAPATSGEYCPSHDPALRERMAQARKLGGQHRSQAHRAEKLMPIHLRPVYNLLAKALVETYQGALSPQQASALSSIAGTMVRVLTAGEMEARLRDLEASMSNRRQGHG